MDKKKEKQLKKPLKEEAKTKKYGGAQPNMTERTDFDEREGQSSDRYGANPLEKKGPPKDPTTLKHLSQDQPRKPS